MADTNNTEVFSFAPDVSQDEILNVQTKQLYQSIYSSLFAAVLNATFLVFVLWPVIAHEVLITWLGSLLIVSFFRGLVAFQFNKVIDEKTAQIAYWYKLFYAGVLFSALVWSSSAIFLFPEEDIARQVFLAFIIGGIVAGSLASLSYSKYLVQQFLIIITVPLLVRFFYSDSEISLMMAVMFCFYILMMLIASKRIHESFKNNIYLHLDSVQREHEVEQSRRHYQTILETSTDLYFLYDINGKIIDVNMQSCYELGYSRDEILSVSMKNIIQFDSEKGTFEQWVPQQNKPITGIETILCRKNGTTFPVEVSVGIINEQSGKLYSAFFRDITERQRMDKMKNEFVSTVSHELRTPLTSIRGSLGLILGGAVGSVSEKIGEMLKLASNNTERLLLLINDILDMQKIESGDIDFNMTSVNLLELIEKSIVENKSYAEQYEVSFTIGETVENAMVLGDKNRIIQVLANLLSNAAKFSHKGDNVEISLVRKQNNFCVSVSDHGQGISESFYDQIFTKFTQYDSSDIRQKGGTGLGLNISKKIIEKHHGTIGFHSKIGEGTTFYFELAEHIGV